jgi:hypothetical protein
MANPITKYLQNRTTRRGDVDPQDHRKPFFNTTRRTFMSEDKTITLGGRNFPIAPLTLGQMRQAAPAFMRIGVDTPEGMGAQTTIIYLAMHAADPKITSADVDAIIGVTFTELKIAVERIAKLMGVEMRAVEPGEAKPVEPAASTTSIGSTSTAA